MYPWVAADALTCYTCNYDIDEDCEGEDVDISEIGTMTDNEDSCKFCYKYSWGTLSRTVERCLSHLQ